MYSKLSLKYLVIKNIAQKIVKTKWWRALADHTQIACELSE